MSNKLQLQPTGKTADNESSQDLLRKVEILEKEIKKLKSRKRYGLVWENKPDQVVELCKEKLPILKEIKELEIKKDSERPTHILIEGDNYHALSVLNYTHKGKVDVIYIDPPYNTGAKDWKYNNNFVDINDSYRHSKWLSMMSERLKVAKNLLKKDGVLICTIDKNEQANLGVLLQEIFDNKEIVCVTIIHNPGGIQGKNFSHTNEFAYFVYPPRGNYISTVTRDDVPPTAFRDWGKESSKREAAKTCFYPIFIKNEDVIGFGEVCPDNFHPKSSNIIKEDGIIEVYPIDLLGVERKWRFGRETVDVIKDELVAKKINDEYSIIREKKDYRWKTVWTDIKYNANVYGTKLLNNIIETKFPYPKSLYAVMDCIKAVIHDNQNSIILDFFAGSGTTGHAVSLLNKEDGGNRQFILCTNNENGIAREVCYPRIKSVIEGNKDYQDITGIPSNLKYFKTDFVDNEPTDRNKKILIDKSTEMLCLKEVCFEEVRIADNFKIFRNNRDKYLGIIYDDEGIEGFKEELEKLKKKIITYIFSLDESAREEEFESVNNLVDLKPIPVAILNVYRRIFK